MDQQLIQYFKQRLLKEKADIKASIKTMEEKGLGMALEDSISELATYDQHPGDVGSEVFERSKDLAIREAERIELEAIEDALLRIENGKYGYCDTCGRRISVARLETIPYTTMCKDCKEKRESRLQNSVCPVEEDVLEQSFGRTSNKGKSGVMFDGEDSWQIVVHWQENAPEAGAGAYYGPSDIEIENAGPVEEVEGIPYEVGDDGVIYQNFTGADDKRFSGDRMSVGIEHEEINRNN